MQTDFRRKVNKNAHIARVYAFEIYLYNLLHNKSQEKSLRGRRIRLTRFPVPVLIGCRHCCCCCFCCSCCWCWSWCRRCCCSSCYCSPKRKQGGSVRNLAVGAIDGSLRKPRGNQQYILCVCVFAGIHRLYGNYVYYGCSIQDRQSLNIKLTYL